MLRGFESEEESISFLILMENSLDFSYEQTHAFSFWPKNDNNYNSQKMGKKYMQPTTQDDLD